jgi:hypothetical protein
MADNYDQCTVDPFLPKSWFTDKDIQNLEAQGFTLAEEDKKHYYLFASEGVCPPYEEEDIVEWRDILQNILKRKKSDIQIIIEGCFYCSKMRMGEFGGHVTLITKDHIFCGSTGSLIQQFQEEIGAKQKKRKRS